MKKSGLLVALVLSGVAAVAHAQGAPPPPPPGEGAPPPPPPVGDPPMAPMDVGAGAAGGMAGPYVQRGVQGPGGHVWARVLANANMSKDQVFKPFSLSPDIFYGLTDDLQIGLVHTGPLGWQTPGSVGTSLCFGGKENGCYKLYNNVGFDALYALLRGPLDLSAHGTFYVRQISDPLLMALSLGVAGKFHFADNLALWFDPQILIGLNKRDGDPIAMVAPNKEVLFVPVELQFQLQPPLALMLQTAVWGQLDGFGDTYRIPVGLAALYTVNEMIDIGARFAFDNLLGKQATFGGVESSRTDERTLSLLANLRF